MQELYQAKLVFYAGSTLLEGPVWDEKNNLIYCVSIEQNQVYAIDPSTGKVAAHTTKGNVGCIAIKEDGKLLVAEKTGIYELRLGAAGEEDWRFIAGDLSSTDTRYNDGKLDPAGNLLVGIKGDSKDYPGEGALYYLDLAENALKPLITGTTIANGLGFNEKGDILYFIDTPTLEVRAYDYDSQAMTATNPRALVTITDGGCPDGMCVDLDGNLWVAEWGGSKVCKWDATTGEKLAQIDLPVANVSSCCLGGENLDLLYITTAQLEDKSNASKDEIMAGALFVAKIRN